MQNWVHGFQNPLISSGAVLDRGPEREWVLGGINRASPLVLRAPGTPNWFNGTGIPVDNKRSYLDFANSDAQKNLGTRIVIGTDYGLIHCIRAGRWETGPAEAPDGTDYDPADGHYEEDPQDAASGPYGSGSESWALIPEHLLDDLKFNYTGANPITAKVDATAVSSIVYHENEWKRVVVFSQGYKGGKEQFETETRLGTGVWALDLTDPDDPIPLWQRTDSHVQDLINPPTMGWVEQSGGDPQWMVAYASGGTPVPDHIPSFTLVNAYTGELIRNLEVGTASAKGIDTMIGTPSFADLDNNGFMDHLFGATSEGILFAYDLRAGGSTQNYKINTTFFLAPNVQTDGTGKATIVALSGDSPLIYDEPEGTFTNSVYVLEYNSNTSTWVEQGNFNLPTKHKAFSRPKLVGSQLIVGTTTGDTFNFCDFDRDDPGDLLLYDLSQLAGDPLEDSVSGFGPTLAPILVSDGAISVHRSVSSRTEPNHSSSVFKHQRGQSSEVKKIPVGKVFGVIGWQNDTMDKLEVGGSN